MEGHGKYCLWGSNVEIGKYLPRGTLGEFIVLLWVLKINGLESFFSKMVKYDPLPGPWVIQGTLVLHDA